LKAAKRVTVAADKGYDTKEFVREMRGMNVTPHVAQSAERLTTGRQRHRWTHHAAARIQSQSGQAETDRGSIRLVEDCAGC
jgi:hypothetical protein